MNRAGWANIETIGFVALKADDRPVVSFFEILYRSDSGTGCVLLSRLDEGTGLFTIETVITSLRIDRQLIKD
jgi:hypothetical protein